MLYRIYTENKNPSAIEKLAGKYFEGFTLIKAEGYWRLQKENSLIIEIEAPAIKRNTINKLGKAIKTINNQQAVLIQQLKNNTWLI